MVPQKLRPQLLEELHTGHLGVVKMKALARSDTPAESTHLTMPVLSLGICTYVIVVDAHSKWPEVIMIKSTTYMKTVEILRTIFFRNGLPEQLVSDNKPQFVS